PKNPADSRAIPAFDGVLRSLRLLQDDDQLGVESHKDFLHPHLTIEELLAKRDLRAAGEHAIRRLGGGHGLTECPCHAIFYKYTDSWMRGIRTKIAVG